MAQTLHNFMNTVSYDSVAFNLLVENYDKSNSVVSKVNRKLDFNSVSGIPARFKGGSKDNIQGIAPAYTIFKDNITGDAYVKSPLGTWVKTFAADNVTAYTTDVFDAGYTYSNKEVISDGKGSHFMSVSDNNTENPTSNVTVLQPLGTLTVLPFSLQGTDLTVNDSNTILTVASDTFRVDYDVIYDDIAISPRLSQSDAFSDQVIEESGSYLKTDGTFVYYGISTVIHLPTFTIGKVYSTNGVVYMHNIEDGFLYSMRKGSTYLKKEFSIGVTENVDYAVISDTVALVLLPSTNSIYLSDNINIPIYQLGNFVASSIATIGNTLYILSITGVVVSVPFSNKKWRTLSVKEIFSNTSCDTSFITVPTATSSIISTNVATFQNVVGITAIDSNTVWVLEYLNGISTIRQINVANMVEIQSNTYNIKYTDITIYLGDIYCLRGTSIVDVIDLVNLSNVNTIDLSPTVVGNIKQVQGNANTLYVYTTQDTLYAFDDVASGAYTSVYTLQNVSTFTRVLVMHSSYVLTMNYDSSTTLTYQVNVDTGDSMGFSELHVASNQFVCYTSFGIFLLSPLENTLRIHSVVFTRRLK